MKIGSAILSITLCAAAFAARADGPGATTATVLGAANPHLIAGAEALRKRQYREGIELTLAGLQLQNKPRDHAAALSNLCAGYVAVKEYAQALEACDQSLVIDRSNWRTWNNRAAAHLNMGRYDAALGDVHSGLEYAPNSRTLRQTLSIVEAHRRAGQSDHTKAVKA